MSGRPVTPVLGANANDGYTGAKTSNAHSMAELERAIPERSRGALDILQSKRLSERETATLQTLALVKSKPLNPVTPLSVALMAEDGQMLVGYTPNEGSPHLFLEGFDREGERMKSNTFTFRVTPPADGSLRTRMVGSDLVVSMTDKSRRGGSRTRRGRRSVRKTRSRRS